MDWVFQTFQTFQTFSKKEYIMEIQKIFENNEHWIKEKLQEDAAYFDRMGSGQSPDILYIGCSDSRVSAEELMGAHPGQIFVHRNIANMVISIDLNVMSVIHYALEYLNIRKVVVCGHYGCGGIRAALKSEDMGVLNPWLRNIRDVYRLHQEELNNLEGESRYRRLVELNVQEQCINLIKTSAVQKAHKIRGIKVFGWVFDVNTGKLMDLKINFQNILEKIKEIYRLD